MKKYLLLFISVFLFLAIGIHFKAWRGYPLEYFMVLPSSDAYGVGMIHPLVLLVAGFLVLLLIFALGHLLKKSHFRLSL